MNRRRLLQTMAASTMWRPLASLAAPAGLTVADETFLDDFCRRGCLFFVEQAGARSGQVLDRAVNQSTTGTLDPRPMASIAATGFGLTALCCIAVERGWQTREAVRAQVERTLDFHLNHMPHEHGFLYHFNDVEKGNPFGGSEVSPIDTSLFLCGVLTARAYFDEDAKIAALATKLYDRVDWPWMLNGGDTFAMGWHPGKSGRPSTFIDSRWNHYCELMMIYLLALGSKTHPVDASTWQAWTRPRIQYAGFDYISDSDPLFVHQYSHAWFDFRHKRDKFANYFENSVTATKAHQAWCLAQGKPYSNDYWGVSASDSAHGYTAWGGPNAQGLGFGGVDGTVVPNATAGSLPFTPAACVRVLRSLKEKYPKAWGRYGLCDAFHPQADYYDPDVLGIDLGISVLMAENLRTGKVWSTFARNPEVGVAMQKAGFRVG